MTLCEFYTINTRNTLFHIEEYKLVFDIFNSQYRLEFKKNLIIKYSGRFNVYRLMGSLLVRSIYTRFTYYVLLLFIIQRRREECERKARRGEMDPRLEFTFQLLIDHTGLSRNSVMDYVFESNMVIEQIQILRYVALCVNRTRLKTDEFVCFVIPPSKAGPDQRAVLAARKIKTHVVLSRRRNRGPGFVRNGNVVDHSRGGDGGGGEEYICRLFRLFVASIHMSFVKYLTKILDIHCDYYLFYKLHRVTTITRVSP